MELGDADVAHNLAIEGQSFSGQDTGFMLGVRTISRIYTLRSTRLHIASSLKARRLEASFLLFVTSIVLYLDT